MISFCSIVPQSLWKEGRKGWDSVFDTRGSLHSFKRRVGGLRLHLLSSLAVDVDEWLLFTDIVIKLVVGDSLQCDQIWPKFCRFGKIFKVYGNSLRVYFCIWQNFKPALSNFLWCVVKFSLLKYPNMGKIFSHMVTLVVVDQGEGETVSTLQNIFYRGSENRTIFLSKGTM